jgi:antitoxin VapB
MAERGIARLFKHGRSQAVRLPAEFRMPGDRVRVKRVGNGVLLEPIDIDIKDVFAEIDKLVQGRFMEEGRDQPPMPPDDDADSFD